MCAADFAKKKDLAPLALFRLSTLGLCGVLLLGSAGEIALTVLEYREAQSEYRTLAEDARKENDNRSGAVVKKVSVEMTEPISTEEETTAQEVDFAWLLTQNADTVGWLSQEDSCIDYPIVQGEDNAFYLRHGFDGSEQSAGCLFADISCNGDFTGRVTILYGHDLPDGSMFSSLNRYRDEAYAKSHPTFTLQTPTETATVRVFTAFCADPAESLGEDSPWRTSFANEDDFAEWLAHQQEHSCIETGETALPENRILVLSTCTGLSGRFLVMGIIE